MTKRELESKINQVKRYLSYAQSYSKISLKQLEEDVEKRLAVERILFLVAQSSIDLAESYCRLKSLERPNSMHESIEILEDNNVINRSLGKRLRNMVGFRNVLTHGYSKIDYEKVIQVLKKGLNDIKLFLKAIR